MFEKNLQLSFLMDAYAGLLSERQQRVLDLYYNQDLSLGEIADDVGISRQGVRDSIKKAERDLDFFESKLHLLARGKQIREVSERVLALCGDQAELQEAARELIRLAQGE